MSVLGSAAAGPAQALDGAGVGHPPALRERGDRSQWVAGTDLAHLVAAHTAEAKAPVRPVRSAHRQHLSSSSLVPKRLV